MEALGGKGDEQDEGSGAGEGNEESNHALVAKSSEIIAHFVPSDERVSLVSHQSYASRRADARE